MLIRQLLIEDYEIYKNEIIKLINDIYFNNFDNSSKKSNKIAYEKVENLKKYLIDGSAIIVGCFNETSLIAFAWLYIHEYFGEMRMHVNQIAVTPSFRGKGIGKQLMLEIEKEGIKRKVDAIDLYVTESNNNAQILYNSLDFKTERRYMVKKMKVKK